MENESIEVTLATHSEMVKEGEDHQKVVLFTKDNTDADKPVIVVNLPPVSFIGGTSKQGRTGNIQGAWDPYRLLAVTTAMGVPVEEAISDIGMNSRRVVVYLEYYGEE